MNTLIERLNQWSALWADAMWAVAWQATLLIVIVAAACWALRRQSPALRYGLWLVLAAKLLVLPFWSVGLPLPSWMAAADSTELQVEAATTDLMTSRASVSAPLPEQSAIVAAPTDGTTIHTTPRWRPLTTLTTWILLVWGAVVVFEIIRVLRQFIQLRGALAASQPVEPAVDRLVSQCARLIGLRKPPQVRTASDDGSPLVCGVLRPVLVLPARLTDEIASDALRQIVLHELAHIKRWDLLTVWALHAMRTAYWFHPAVHWVVYRAGLERELACDQLAMVHSGVSAAAYAHTLIDAAGRAAQPMVLNAAVAARLDGGIQLAGGTP